MLMAVRHLCSEGSLRTSHGRGTTVVPMPAGAAPAREEPAERPCASGRSSTSARLQLRLERDIVNGRYQPGSLLPPAKELLQRYGVCHQTLRRALTGAEHDGRLQQARRRYRVPDLPQSAGRDTVVLVALGNQYGSLQVISPRVEEHLRTLERECARAGLRLAVYTYDQAARLFHSSARRRLTLADIRAGGGGTRLPGLDHGIRKRGSGRSAGDARGPAPPGRAP
jgi:DNA-binding FadR family transcriptional regulator